MTRALRLFLAAALLAAGPVFAEEAPHSPAEPRFDVWQEILEARVNERGEVAYRTLAAFDRERLESVVDSFAKVDVDRLEGEEAVAFWINAYNAGVVWAILHGGRPETIRGRARLYGWLEIDVGGRRRTLDAIQAELARYAARDPRIHLALCNGTKSSPVLARQPYRAKSLDEQLEEATSGFVNDASRNRTGGKRPALAPLFSWHRTDFTRETGTIAEWVAKHVSDSDRATRLGEATDGPAFLEADWSLNAAPGEDPAKEPPASTARR